MHRRGSGRVRLDLVLEDAEAVLGHQLSSGLARLRVLSTSVRLALQRVDGRAPVRSGASAHHAATQSAARLGGGRLPALVGGPGGARGVDAEDRSAR